MTLGIRLRHLACTSPLKPPATIQFGAGLNVIYGASDTGKSFIANTIDFMLGGKGPLEDIPEREGYDRVFLGIEDIATERAFTIHRAIVGGTFTVFSGLHEALPEQPGCELADQHNERRDDNLSRFLLGLISLDGKRLRKNKNGETVSLSFRNLARLSIVNEEEIIQKRSPLSDGNVVADTPNTATFKLLLTGVDDSALKPPASAAADQSRQAQIELLDQLIDEHNRQIKELSGPAKELEDQAERLEASLQAQSEQLSATETRFREFAARRRELRRRWDNAGERLTEIDVLEDRFALLDKHYTSDIERLKGVEEAGTLFQILEARSCPLCGAAPHEQDVSAECTGNTQLVIDAARSEIEKISRLQVELVDARAQLGREKTSLQRLLPRLEQDLQGIAETIDNQISPNLRAMRNTYAELSDKKADVRESLGLFKTVQGFEERRTLLSKEAQSGPSASNVDSDLPSSSIDKFAACVEKMLKEWHFPGVERVHFERGGTRDLIIDGKKRTSFGKGLRAITQSAFTIGLLEFCRENDRPHPGFVVLDSPLLSYKEPDGAEDDLRGTDLKVRFYEQLKTTPGDRQIIIIENTDPPADIQALNHAVKFTRSHDIGRFGYFPIPAAEEEKDVALSQ